MLHGVETEKIANDFISNMGNKRALEASHFLLENCVTDQWADIWTDVGVIIKKAHKD